MCLLTSLSIDADIVCSRAKNHYPPEGNLNLDTSSVDTSQTESLEAFRSKFVPLHKNQQRLMYFSVSCEIHPLELLDSLIVSIMSSLAQCFRPV